MSYLNLSAWEGLTALGCLVGLGGLIAVGEGLRALGMRAKTTRRVVHAGVGLFVAATPFLFSRPLPVYGLAVLFVLINTVARSRQWWRGIHEARPESWGTVTLPLAVLPALAATWSVGVDRVFVLQASFLVLAIADPMASALGEVFGRRRLGGDVTWVGSATFFATFALVTVLVLLATEWSTFPAIAAALGVAVVGTAVEGVCRRGWDNLFVVFGSVFVLVPLHIGHTSFSLFGVALATGGGFGAIAYWSRTLNGPGAVGGALFAASLVGLGGWAWAVPGFVFFGLSSVLSRLPGKGRVEGDGWGDEEGRTLRQVLANGGIAWAFLGIAALVPLSADELRFLCYAGFLGALAAAAADTWATEVGMRGAAQPVSIRTLSPVVAGTSGAVSFLGTGAALFGAASVAGAALLVAGAPLRLSWMGAGGVVVAGLAGMFIDSLVGATVQAQYQERGTGQILERPVGTAALVRGWSGVDNEVVNLLGTATGALLALVLIG